MTTGFVLAGTASGVGKTVATLAVCRALDRAGHAVQPAKTGPDFIDPSHHERATGVHSRTLDPWLCGDDGLLRQYHRGTGVRVVEGAMGLYDGDVSTARVAAALDLPVVLVVDASAGMQSVAATALGFREYAARTDHAVDVAGVLAARVAGERHAAGVHDALPDDLQWCGAVPERDDLAVPDRHLGLHMADERPVPDDALDAAAEWIDVEALLALAREPPGPPSGAGSADDDPADVRVAVARDDAFRFVYPATAERLRERGEVVTFSPVAGDDLPACDAVYLPGGYPELHAAALADAPALAAIRERASDGLPVLGECGGLMALCETLTTDATHEMAGVLPADVAMHDAPQAIDHVELRAREDAPTAAADTTLRGHEFHYSRADPATDARYAFDVERGRGVDGEHDGLTAYRTLGTYCHVHAESGAFDRLLAVAGEYART